MHTEYVEDRVAIHILAGELNSTGRPYSRGYHDRSWLRDTLKRKLVDFASNRRFFYLPGACLPFFGYTWLKFFNQPDFVIRGACFDQSSGQPRVYPGKQEQGGAQKIKKTASFLFEVSFSQRQPYSRGYYDRLLTEDDDADAADTYDSDTDAAAYGGDEL